MHSCLYVGRVRHRRWAPRVHAFQYPLSMLLLDLGEIDSVFRGRWLWSTRRAAPGRWRRADHIGDSAQSLDDAVRDRVEAALGVRPRGPVRLLTQPRYFGIGFNPVSFYYCYDAARTSIEAEIAEVHNTPWGERHCYVRGRGRDLAPGVRSHELRKEFHVSPFMPMDIDYRWRLSDPGARLLVHMENWRAGERLFDATLTLSRQPLDGPHLARLLLAMPPRSVQVLTGIYWQALRLWLKGCPFYPHPGKLTENKPA